MSDNVDAQCLDPMDEPDARGVPSPPAPAPAPAIRHSEVVADSYKMNHERRGMAVIINNRKFHSDTRMGERNGTDVDADAMYELLDTLGFERIEQKDNQTVKQMQDKLIEVSRIDHSSSDCFVCVILSHGEEGFVYGFDGKIAIDDLVKPFKGNNCKSLAGKPKLFFIQACRGSDLDHGVTVADAAGEDDDVAVRHIPTEADFMIAYSVVPGFYSWRNSANGSWFIQAVVEVFKKNWQHMDVLTMMTRVNKIVAYDFQSKCSEEFMNKKKQVPCVTSMLTKDVFFRK